MKLLRQLLVFVGALLPIALAVALVLIYWGEPLEDIAGRPASPDNSLLERARSALLAGRPFECDAASLNAHIAAVLEAREAEGFEIFAEFKGLWVRLHEGEFELVFERDVLGISSTVSARIEVARKEDGHGLLVTGGRFGRLPVPRGAMNALRIGLLNVGRVFVPEKDVLSRVARLTISPGRLRLEPRPSGG